MRAYANGNGRFDPLTFFEPKIWRKNRGGICETFQRDARSSRFQREIESFLKVKSSRFQSVRTGGVSAKVARQDSNLQSDRYERPALTN
jgi:hypothetical protein